MADQRLERLPLPAADAAAPAAAGPGPAFLRTGLLAKPPPPLPVNSSAEYPFAGLGVYRYSNDAVDLDYIRAMDMRQYRKPKKPRHRKGGYDSLVEPHVCVERRCFWRCHHVNPLVFQNLTAFRQGDAISQYLAQRVTIIVTAAAIPGNPSTILLTWLLQSLYQMPELRQCARVLVMDYPKPKLPEDRKSRYTVFKQRVRKKVETDPLYQGMELIEAQQHGHLTGSIRLAMERVKTKYVFVLQQDVIFAQPADMFLSLRTMELNPLIKHLRYNSHPNTPAGYDYRMDVDAPSPSFVPLIRTEGWSDQNHLSTVAYYNEVVLPHANQEAFKHKGGFMEAFMNEWWDREFASNRNWSLVHNVFGTYIYGVPAEAPYSLHVDGSEKHGGLSPMYSKCVDD